MFRRNNSCTAGAIHDNVNSWLKPIHSKACFDTGEMFLRSLSLIYFAGIFYYIFTAKLTEAAEPYITGKGVVL